MVRPILTPKGNVMRPGTYRLPSGDLLRCRIDAAGAARLEIEGNDGGRREVDDAEVAGPALLSDDPAWPFTDSAPVALGADE